MLRLQTIFFIVYYDMHCVSVGLSIVLGGYVNNKHDKGIDQI